MFDLHGYSTAAQMELTGQLLSSLSLPSDSAPRTKEPRTALEESFAMHDDGRIHPDDRGPRRVVESAAAAGEGDVYGMRACRVLRGKKMCWSVSCAQGRGEPSCAQAIRNDIVGTHLVLGEVLAKWDYAHDMRRFAMYPAELDSLYS